MTSLNQLAANPPQYPINPSETKQEPLTLYLSRVPGTRGETILGNLPVKTNAAPDVILSPFKPQLKNVTNQDVASSLYYVHHEITPPNIPHPAPIREYRSSSDGSPITRAIPRKPVAGTVRPPTPEAASTQDAIPAPLDPTRRRGLSASAGYDAAQTSRPGPVESGVPLGDFAPEPKSRPTPELMAPLARRPTGPRPMTSPGPNPPIGAHKDLPPVPRQLDDPPIERRPVPNRGQSRSTSPGKSGDSAFSTPFTLTLIRRDPSTGNQWNVGRISSYQEDAQNEQDEYSGMPLVSSAPPPNSSGRPPINIQLETLGYAKFRHMPAKRSLDTSPSGIRDVIASMAMKDGGQGQNDGVTFSRQVVMGYSKSFSTSLKEKWHQIEQQGRTNYSHHRQASVTSVGSTGSTGSNDDTPDVVTQPGPGLKPRGYMFSSPWDGRCEFRTGNAGRSVRCVHILHDDDTAAFNPLVGGGPGAIGPIQGGSMTVSELRFNLPSTELFKTQEGRRDAKAQLQGHFNKLLNRKNDGSDEDDGTVSPFDMNLGRERAGGGNRGKRAKLGKLIIHQDGLKMLDLIVAANIGVWWGAWERSF